MITALKLKGELMIFEDTQMNNLQYSFVEQIRSQKICSTSTSSPNCNCHKDDIDLDKKEKTQDLAYAKLNTSLFVP